MYLGALLWDNSEFSATVKMKRQGEIDWPRHYAALVEYGKEYGTCNVQKKFKFEEYNCILHGLGDNGDDFHYSSKLGTWLANQRSFHNGRRGEARRLTPEREELMQRLVNEGKLLWDASEMSGTKVYGQTSWPLNYAALLQYRQLYGHCHVSQSFNFECMIPGENGQEIPYRGNLGRWLMTQRQSKKGQRNPLSPERDALLQKLQDEGVFAWEPSTAGVRAPTIRKNTFGKHIAESDWEIHYLALIEYSKIHGNCNIPQKEEFECDLPGMGEGGQTFKYKGRLGQWVRSQRQLKRALDMNESTSQKRGDKPEHKGTIQTLSPDREAKLQKLVNEGI